MADFVWCVAHDVDGPHRVAPTAAGLDPRLAMSLFASKPEDYTGFVQPSSTLPPLWALKTLRNELPPSLAEFFRNGVDRDLTGGTQNSTEDWTHSGGKVVYHGGGARLVR